MLDFGALSAATGFVAGGLRLSGYLKTSDNWPSRNSGKLNLRTCTGWRAFFCQKFSGP